MMHINHERARGPLADHLFIDHCSEKEAVRGGSPASAGLSSSIFRPWHLAIYTLGEGFTLRWFHTQGQCHLYLFTVCHRFFVFGLRSGPVDRSIYKPRITPFRLCDDVTGQLVVPSSWNNETPKLLMVTVHELILQRIGYR